MAKIVELPRLSDTMQEGAIAKWHVAVGDKVKRGQVIAEIETDKATMEFESFDAGTVLELIAPEGETLPLGAPIAVLGSPGEDPKKALPGSRESTAPAPDSGAKAGEAAVKESAQAKEEPDRKLREDAARAGRTEVTDEAAPAKTAAATAPPEPARHAALERTDERIAASPLARKIAREHGVDLKLVQGSGPRGRIVKTDVEAAAGGRRPGQVAGRPATEADRQGRPFVTRPAEEVKLSQMRKTIARRMGESFRDIPHFYLTASIRMDRVAAMRSEINESIAEGKISFNDFLVYAVARALRQYPRVNGFFAADKIVRPGDIHVGVAVALDDGLVVPVIRHADQKSLGEISLETRDLGKRAKDKSLRPEEMTGSTFTVSNLGMFGIDHFSAVINPGEGAILAVGAIRDVVGVGSGGKLEPHKEMKVTLACDHRAMDGADGAKFLAQLTRMLEQPMAMFA